MSDLRLIKKQAVIAKCAISHATLYRLISSEQFPASIRLGKRAVAWLENEVDEWIRSRPRTRTIE
jgi:prophage regulatory protein